jgi:hypothetical protein
MEERLRGSHVAVVMPGFAKAEDGMCALSTIILSSPWRLSVTAMVFSPSVMARIAEGLRCAGFPRA